MTKKEKECLKDAMNTLLWIIKRIETETDKRLEGCHGNWKKAAHEVVEEAYGVRQRIGAVLDDYDVFKK
jgi:hypothetical protein